jgi:LuxR family transcriptional regulator, quorum-sensing system regulator SolR
MFSPQETAHDICSAGSSIDVFEKLVGYAKRLGFEYCCYGFKAPFTIEGESVKIFDTYPNGWMAHYHRMEYIKTDPTVSQALRCTGTIVWPAHADSRRSRFWQDAREHGLAVGVGQPSWSARGAFGLLSFARSSDDIGPSELESLTLKLNWIANSAHSAMTMYVLDSLGMGEAVALTGREREVLQWTVEGMNAFEISDKLQISVSTVNWHIGKVIAKFRANNKVQAASRAVALNLL